MKKLVLAATCVACAAFISSAVALADVKVSDQSFVRHDGGSDAVIANCSNDTAGSAFGGNRQQNEPAVAIDQNQANFIAAGANEYCIVPETGDAWEGVYVSSNGGASWTDSLLPGYPGDTSTEGQASPLYGVDSAAGDPIMDWDNSQNLFVGGIAFNRSVPVNPNAHAIPTNGHMFIATYHRDPTAPLGIDYLRTVVVGQGTPGNFPAAGRFNDKPSLKVDDWPGSPRQGNVYAAWALFPGAKGVHDQILFSRSTNHGASFSTPIKLNKGTTRAQGADVAVAPNGDIYVVWRAFFINNVNPDEIVFVKSTNGGLTFTDPRPVATPIIGYDSVDQYAFDGLAGDCGSLVVLCVSHFTFHRNGALPGATADVHGNVYVTWEQLDQDLDNGDTYHPDGQSQVVISRSTDGGDHWTPPQKADSHSVGHQFWPNLEYDMSTDKLALTFYDSREDSSYSPFRPSGNTAAGTSPCLGASGIGTQPCDVLNTFIATSPGGNGLVWSSTKVSSVGHQGNFEMFGGRSIPFHGDYIWVDADAGHVFGTWTDNRDVVPGTDPRETEKDGFDVLQCRAQNPNGSFGADTCANAGGVNQNIYGASLP